MHQHIQFHLFLIADAAGNFLLHLLGVVGIVQAAGFPVAAGGTNLPGLREGADGGGGEGRQLQRLLLPGNTLGKGAVAVAGDVAGRGQPFAHDRVMDTIGQAAGLQGVALGL